MTLKDQIKRKIKSIVSIIFYYSGIILLYRLVRMQNKAVILMYHRVVKSLDEHVDYSPDGMTVDERTFSMHMEHLAKQYSVISLGELVDSLHSERPLPKNACVITFDDGFRDIYDIAYPIMRKHNVTATVFLTLGFIENKEWFWEERLKYLLAEIYAVHRRCELKGRHQVAAALNRHGLTDFLELDQDVLPDYLMDLVRDMRALPVQQRSALISDLEMIVNAESIKKNRRYLRWEEIEEMSSHGIDFGAHTVSHQNLTLCPSETAIDEIRGSKQGIEKILGNPVTAFAYPYGKYNESVKSMVRQCGFRCACVIEHDFVESSADAFALKRISVHNDVASTKAFFSCRILKIFNLY